MRVLWPAGSSFPRILSILFLLLPVLWASAGGSEQPQQIVLTVDVFSGRPNPTLTIADPRDVARIQEIFKRVSPCSATAEEEQAFSRLGYRGVVISNPEGLQGLPARFQALNGKLRIPGDRGTDTRFYRDAENLEKFCLDLAKKRGLLTDLLEKQIVPDPDRM